MGSESVYSLETKRKFWASLSHHQRDVLRRLSRNLDRDEFIRHVDARIRIYLQNRQLRLSRQEHRDQ